MRTVRSLPRRQFPFILFPAEFPLAFRLVLAVIAVAGFSSIRAAAQANTSAAYTWTTFAGLPDYGTADGAGSAAQFTSPVGLAVDTNGNVFVTDIGVVREINPGGLVTTILGYPGTAGIQDGVGTAARISGGQGLAVDGAGNVYVADGTVRKISYDGTNWAINTLVVDNILTNYQGNLDAEWIAADAGGNLYVLATRTDTLYQLVPDGTNWSATVLAGGGSIVGGVPPLFPMPGTNDGAGIDARFDTPIGIVVDASTNIYVGDFNNSTVRKISPAGTDWVVSTIAGSPGVTGTKDGVGSNALFISPDGITMDAAGNLYVSDWDGATVRKLSPVGPNWLVSTFAGSGTKTGDFPPVGVGQLKRIADGTGTNSAFFFPEGMASDAAGNIYVADWGNLAVREITPAAVVSTLAGNTQSSGSENGTGSTARFAFPQGEAMDHAGNIYVADTANNIIRKVTAQGVVSIVAGLAGAAGNADGAGTDARFNEPTGITLGGSGNLFVADYRNGRIRKISSSGVVTTIAGSHLGTESDGTNSDAVFTFPYGITSDADGNLFVSDSGGMTIRKITPEGTNWVVTTIAGVANNEACADGTNSDAAFAFPAGIVADKLGNIFVADELDCTIRKITPQGTNWVVTTIAGQPFQYFSDDGNEDADGLDSDAIFTFPVALTMDGQGNLYASGQGSTIRKITPQGSDWSVTTIGGLAGFTGSVDGAGDHARFTFAQGIAVNASGVIYAADTKNNTIRKGMFTAYTGANPGTFTPPDLSAQLQVFTQPAEASGQWRFAWEQGWHNSGDMESGLAAGNYPVQFRSLSGYLAVPQTITVPVTNGGLNQFTNQYLPTLSATGTNTGALTVNIGPNSPAGSGWRFLGETPWRPPGSSAAGLIPDTYFIEFEPVNGRVKPSSQAVLVYPGQTTLISETYLLSQSPPANVLLPVPVPPGNISDLADYPFGFNGQLQSDVGYGSGVAVQTNVVLTAAHMVFNDETLSYVSQAYWYFEQETGTFQPQPMQARGWYVLSGYAAERTNDLDSGLVGPDQSTPQSRNLDVAALYFLSPVAGGGYGGYLPSDQTPNTWLTGNSLKLLAGYPVDGSLFGDASIVPGEMYQTQPQPYPLTLSPDPVAGQEVYVAPWFLSYPGNSGGPLYVQFNGYYYPAGVYLGTLYNGTVPYASAVRAIDSNVVNLITLAQVQGDNGTNNTGGGVITIIPNQAISGSNPGYVQLHLEPPGAVAAGAAWKLGGDASYSTATNYTRAVFTTNAVTLQFKPITGWNLPTNQTVSVAPGNPAVLTAVYTVAAGPMTLEWEPGVGLGITGTTGTVYELDYRTNLTSGSWLPLSTNTITGSGFNLVLPWPPANGPTAFYRAITMQ